ncbi:MAG: ATP-binding protein [Polyangiaceae bacterium]
MPSPLTPIDFEVVFNATPGLAILLSPDLRILAITDALLASAHAAREDILGRPLFDVFPGNPNDGDDGVNNLGASLHRVLAHKKADAMAVQKWDVERPAAEGGGFEERYWSPVNSPIFGADGEVQYILHRVEDVTNYVRLRKEQTAMERITEDLRTAAGGMEAEILRRAQQLQDTNRELRVLQAELEHRVSDRTADLTRANDELRREVAEHRRTTEALDRSEAQLQQSQKMEAVGRLAGGIAHDFNNLLTVILTNGELVLMDLPAADPLRGDVEQIVAAGKRAADLTRQLLAFSRRQVLELKLLDLNEILMDLSKMLQRVLGEDIDLAMKLSKATGKIRADRGRIEQVLMNLVVNARDAMGKGGKLSIETSEVDLDDAYAAEHHGVAPGPYVQLAVSDTGCGMDKATQARIFEPFFTTKERGKGTGLGLSTVFGIVKQSGGSVWVYSEPGAGTTFKIYLPRAERTAIVQTSIPPTPSSRPATESILLCEDDDQVRAVAAHILRRAGYVLLEASTPEQAIALASQPAAKMDLLLTDVVMPHLNGRALADRILELRPGLKVLFMSGYTDDVILHHGIVNEGVKLVEKPLTPAVLNAKIREVLDAP